MLNIDGTMMEIFTKAEIQKKETEVSFLISFLSVRPKQLLPVLPIEQMQPDRIQPDQPVLCGQ